MEKLVDEWREIVRDGDAREWVTPFRQCDAVELLLWAKLTSAEMEDGDPWDNEAMALRKRLERLVPSLSRELHDDFRYFSRIDLPMSSEKSPHGLLEGDHPRNGTTYHIRNSFVVVDAPAPYLTGRIDHYSPPSSYVRFTNFSESNPYTRWTFRRIDGNVFTIMCNGEWRGRLLRRHRNFGNSDVDWSGEESDESALWYVDYGAISGYELSNPEDRRFKLCPITSAYNRPLVIRPGTHGTLPWQGELGLRVVE